MKKLFFYFLLIILLGIGLEKVIAAQQYYYVVFDNLDKIVNTEGQELTNAFDQLYYDPIHKYPFGDYLIKLPFSDATFTNYRITDFDLAVFPMGDKPLNFSTSGGITVLSKIKEMEAAGKRVIIIGRSILRQSQTSQPVQQFLYDYLGVDEVFMVNTTSGSKYAGYTINGVIDDTLANGTRKWGNLKRGENNIPPADPWRWVSELEAFKVRPDDWRFTVIDWFSKVTDDVQIINYPPTDTIMGVRTHTPHSKMVFWCYGTEYLCAVGSIPRHATELWYAFNWLLFDVPKIGPYLQSVPNPLQFGGRQIGTDTTKRIVITNFGRQELKVTDVYVNNFEDPEPFEVLGPTSFNLQPLDTHSVFVKFAPTEEKSYLEILSFESNSGGNPSLIDMELKGVGGKDPEQGPIIDVVTSVNFGEVKIGRYQEKDIVIHNIGTAPLIINYNNFSNNGTNNGNGAFTYNDRRAGFQINPDSTYTMVIRFTPHEAGLTYNGEIKLETNQKGDNPFTYIKLTGKGAVAKPKMVPFPTSVIFDTVLTGYNKEIPITIKNTGSAELVIDSINFIRNDSSAFSITEGGMPEGGTPITVLPVEEHILKVQFTPSEELTYNATIQIVSNYEETPNYNIYFNGVGRQDTVGVEDEYDFAGNELFVMKAMPNPNYGKAMLEYILKGDVPRKVDIFIIDVLGNRISNILKTNLNPGDYRCEMDMQAIKLASGNYYIIANVGDSQVRLPIVILK
ncbi:MAG: choice-of-anchor D domain-containing protein [Bacteroidetes bacterium]|nr:MAG: choice-of-anchor D domain-containing protein [Bacteroidota bacterium]